LQIQKIVLSGMSGGGNLALASALKAKGEGYLNLIDGLYALCPYISGAYAWSDEKKLAELPSLLENNGYFIGPELDFVATAYEKEPCARTNPLMWPYHATEKDLEGFPPTVITVGECDPLRDEGIGFYRKLQKANVKSYGKVWLGVYHGGELARTANPDMYFESIDSIRGFTCRL